jgi:S1-C subfamily serine protease
MRNAIAVLMVLAIPAASGSAGEVPFLGIAISDVPEVVARHLGVEAGVLVNNVLPESPAWKAGLQRHDVIVAGGGEKVDGPVGLKELILGRQPGDMLALKVRRGEKTLQMEVKLGAREAPSRPEEEKQKQEEKKQGFLGICFSPVPEVLAVHLGLEEGTGVIVDDVLEDSAAAKAGIEKSDVLVAVEGQEIRDPEELHRAIAARREGDRVALKLIHKGKKKDVEVTLGAAPEATDLPIPDFPLRRHFPEIEIPGLDFKVAPYFRGKIIIKDPDGKERVIEIPQVGDGLKDLQRKLEKEYEKHLKTVPGDLHRRIKRLLEELEDKDLDIDLDKFLPGGLKDRVEIKTQGSVVAVTRVIDGGYDITIRQEDGRRTVTVKKDGKTLAADLPLDRLESLPEEARERVRKLEDTLPESYRGPAPDGDKKKSDSPEKPAADADKGIRV